MIEARQFRAEDLAEMESLARWCGGRLRGYALPLDQRVIQIDTLEGEMEADPGDWILRGVKGECYPCKPDIFAMTYDPAE
ncbi:hypothetical protein [Thauera sp.]|uniref:hypothetical protein n=1 Tax=Thauera sp. TaxID=1905334 RepID=UPI002D1FA296|nr:hypothetical protein [Thauera sp.]